MNRDEVLNLAKLVRIEIENDEAENLSYEFDAILGYVGEVRDVAGNLPSTTDSINNVMREDGEPHQSGLYTENVLSQAPARKDNYLKVKKIL